MPKFNVRVSLPSYETEIDAIDEQDAEDKATTMLQEGKFDEGLGLYGRLEEVTEIVPPAPPAPRYPAIASLLVEWGPAFYGDLDEPTTLSGDGAIAVHEVRSEGATVASIITYLVPAGGNGTPDNHAVGVELTADDCVNLAYKLWGIAMRAVPATDER